MWVLALGRKKHACVVEGGLACPSQGKLVRAGNMSLADSLCALHDSVSRGGTKATS